MKQQIDIQRRVLENLSSTVMLFDSSLRLEYINPAGEMLFAASSRHLLGAKLMDLLGCDVNTEFEMQEALLSGHPVTQHEMSVNLLHADEITVDMTIIPLREPDQPPALLIEMIKMDRLLRISRDESRAAQQKTTQEILRGLAHEVKNPLGGLRGAAQLLEKQLDSEDLREYTKVIIDEADRLQNLVNRILGPSGMINKRPINIHEVLERVRSVMLAETHEGLTIQRDYDPSIPDIDADADQLIQALLNIARNSSQAMDGKGNITFKTRIARNYTIGTQHHKLVACIEIIDNGPGIPEDIQENLFFPMVTGRPDGTGLGLSIAQALVRQHDGLVEFESEPGKTVFMILLPVNDDG